MRLRLEHYDQNEDFGKLLPRDGGVDRWLSSAGGTTWAVFRPDKPIEYENHWYSFFLLRSRWLGQEVGEPEPTSVFILLVDDEARLKEGFEVNDFTQVAWGMASMLS